ncbi:type VI secretion system Vgr family protein [Pseudomonas gingeri]|uniref:type VI secretion system Vgr family protein n=1 Tax=Pseudomonas gingeri TaxID=117681 RepID=UPI0015A1C901|nr:type VI secretion system tip protein TssI/VgrG [Pseudomonas gingeri]NWD03871.1 type VI secretion system tip protein VgrG [Pseudomonas gingeri]NWD48977.1 type VI secretion system tip protein VgrG [Pseudomonas gingeri]NWE33669.1 type VI secretion system tip protein VgrG [Pseudomonas gingeri]NWE58245.1 type VI secretion system tip protein VgrG [Pseudomonas gingeri]NWF04604.1 type VI secretion system tip protein VgrG [Pseudomonas gingeri]
MAQDKERLFSLTILPFTTPFQVIHFSGREELNRPYRFEIELLGDDPGLDLQALLQQPAFLSFGLALEGAHGLIHEASSRYLSADVCHYRMVLAPRLQLLERHARRRVFYNLSIPDILRQLLESHGLGTADYRFELHQGTYPPRPQCQQHDQNDLQWLNRLCEEEGIHYHFEHSPRRHIVVFAEDPQAFAERPGTVRYCETPPKDGQPVISRLHERHAMLAHAGPHRPLGIACPPWPGQSCSATPEPDGAANQTEAYGLHSAFSDPQQRHARQRSRRTLERLRCESRQVQGSSNLGQLHSGDVHRLSGHPRAALNDQWLIIEVQHWGEQRLDGEALEQLCDEYGQVPLADEHFEAHGYSNHFRAIPWATPFRPALRQARARQQGYQLGTVLGPPGQSALVDAQGRLPIQLHGAQHSADHLPGCWIPMGIAEGTAPPVGSQVLIDCVDHDPDQLVVCGFLAGRESDSPPDAMPVEQQPTLQQGSCSSAMSHPATAPGGPDAPGEIHLYERPQNPGRCLCDSIWYIVRMPRPGLKELARLGRADILLEGRSDTRGVVALSPYQQHRLALELGHTPEQLWLLYPGQCVALHDYLRQHWSLAQRQALLQANLDNAPDTCRDELNSVYEWLIRPAGPD